MWVVDMDHHLCWCVQLGSGFGLCTGPGVTAYLLCTTSAEDMGVARGKGHIMREWIMKGW